jgi:hypothetical protein
MPGDKLAVVRLFAIVEVGIDGVFQQMHHAIAAHDQNRSQARAQAQAFGHHLKQGGGDQKAGPQGHEVAQVALDALGAHQHQPAGHVGQRGNRAENE